MSSNSSLYERCVRLNKEELTHPEKITEISLSDARKLAGFGEAIAEQLEIYNDNSSDNLEKSKALKTISDNYKKMETFTKSNIECFEPRNVFIRKEYDLIESGIDVKGFSEQIREIKNNEQ